jgi:hypothetical protein
VNGLRVLACAGVVHLAGCAVAEHPYPPAWDPLVPHSDSDCRHFMGRYADRGERDDEPSKPSLTRQLFGESSDWETASVVTLAMPRDGTIEATASGERGPIASRTLLRDHGFDCRGGRLILRDRRWIASYVLSGRQHVELDFNEAGKRVAVQVDELAYGVLFVVFPLIGTARHWYRFERLP